MPWLPKRSDSLASPSVSAHRGRINDDWHNPGVSWERARKLTGNPEREWSFPLFTERVWVLSGRMPRFFYEPLHSWDATVYATWLGHEFGGRGSSPFVSIGFTYFDGFYRAPSGRISLPGANEPYRGRHQVDAVGQRGDDIVFVNSWSERWGDRGYGTMSREYFDRYVDNVIVRWVSDEGPSPAMFAAMNASKGRRRRTSVEDFRAHWGTVNPTSSSSYTLGGRSYTLISWSVLSLDNWKPVWVLELSNPVRVVGRAHLHVNEHPEKVTFKELFIDPGVRRRGLGSFLLRTACSLAADYGFESISAWVDEADDQDPENTAQAFFDAHGWESEPGSAPRPVLATIRTKELS